MIRNRVRKKLEEYFDIILAIEKVHFLHIGKTGGSAIKFALKGHQRTKNYVIHLHEHHFRLDNIPKGEKLFFGVRDPVDRFISAFYSRKREGKPRYAALWSEEEKEAFNRFETPNELALALSVKDDIVKSEAIRAMRSIAHVKDSYWDWFVSETYFLERMSDVLFVCEQENLENDFKRLKDILSLPKHIELPKDSYQAHANPKDIDKKLESQAVINLKRWYSKDYEFLELLKKSDLIKAGKQVKV